MDNKLHRTDVDLWMTDPMTKWYMRRLLNRFNLPEMILASKTGETVDYYRGIAEVLRLAFSPKDLIED